MKNNFLLISTWWGFDYKPGNIKMYINVDGSFTLKKEYAFPKDKKENREKKGLIDQKRMAEIRELIEKNVTKDSHNLIFDAGYEIEYKKGDKVIKVVNDMELWEKIIKLIPEFNEF